MGSTITGILTDTSMRNERAIEDSLIMRAEAGKAWASDVKGGM